MKKILFCKQQLSAKGGLEKYAERLIKAFVQRGCEVTLVSSSPNCSFENIKSVHLPIQGLFGFQKLKNWDAMTKDFSKRHPHDIVFTLDRITNATHIRAGNGVHASYLHKRNEGLLRRFSFKVNPLHKTILNLEAQGFHSKELRKIIVNSHMVKEEIITHYNVDPSKIEVHHNGVEYEEMSTIFDNWEKTRSDLQRELQLSPNLYTFLFAGHHYKRKGLDDLLLGFAKIQDAQLLVVGKEKNAQRYRSLVHTLGLSGRVHFLGQRSDMRRLYAASDALVVPSLYDPFANVTVEALAMGLFVVSSSFNGGKEILDEHSGCVIEDLFDPSSIASSLEKAMRSPKTIESARCIRAKVSSFDFTKKLPQIIDSCLN
jgi:UDP-glucose:(heptosyl)LPS alpha-1,3-glucosyltransferase